MDWNGNFRPFVTRPDNSLTFLCNYNYDQFPGMEMKHAAGVQQAPTLMDKKKRLSSDQLESLESSFQEEIKLDPDRKMKLAKELGLQPRQIAVWFQNRRARWKAKQLERLYDALKQEFDAVSREKQKLQEEVIVLRAILKDEAGAKKQVSTGYNTEISGEETVESTSIPSSNIIRPRGPNSSNQMESSFVFNVDDYNVAMQPYWTALPPYPGPSGC